MNTELITIVMGAIGTIFGLIGALLAWSLSRNVADGDRRVGVLESRADKSDAGLTGVRVELADCVRRTSFDEVNAKISDLDRKIERLLTLAEKR